MIVAMRAVAIALSVTLAACRFGFDLLPTGDCPQGNCTIDDADPNPDFDAPRGDPAVDTDGDGVFDDTDNCISIQNPAQHDEDTDGYGDVCDNCPTVANPNQANLGETNAGQTADSVGDACDPRPTLSGESIAYFEPFAGATLSPDWMIVNGTWPVSGDAVQQMSLVSDQRMHNPAAVAVNDYIAEATFTFATLDTGNVNGGILWRVTGNNGWLCAVFHDDTITPAMSLLMIWSMQNGAASFERNRATIPDITTGSRYRILAGAYGSNHYCALDSLQTGPTAPFTSNQNNSGVPGFRTNRVTGSYSSFVVYTLGGPI
jgi:hypothetical protein